MIIEPYFLNMQLFKFSTMQYNQVQVTAAAKLDWSSRGSAAPLKNLSVAVVEGAEIFFSN